MAGEDLTLATINIDGIKSNTAYVQHLLNRFHLVLVQEHWLHNYELHILKEMFPSASIEIKCHDDNLLIPPDRRKRGVAGVATLWSNKHDNLITPLKEGSPRCVTVLVETSVGPVAIVNTYLPTEGSHDKVHSYEDILDEVFELKQRYPRMIWAGDLNGDFNRCPPSSNDRKLVSFCHEMGFEATQDTEPSYYHFSGNSSSRIDHILQNPRDNLLKHRPTVEDDPINVGPHKAVTASLLCKLQQNLTRLEKPKPAPKRLNWDKINTQEYARLTERRLQALIDVGGLTLHPEILVDRLNEILLESAIESSPTPKVKKRANKKHNWSPELKPLFSHSRSLYHSWLNQGKPSPSPAEDKLKQLKKEIRGVQRQTSAQKRRDSHAKICDTYHNDQELFYKLVRDQRGGPPGPKPEITAFHAESQIEGWASYFKQLSSPSTSQNYDECYYNSAKIQYSIRQLQATCSSTECPPVSSDQVKKYVRSLKNKKAVDISGLTAEFIKLAHPLLLETITHLINNITQKRKIPDKLKTGIITPVPKKNKQHNLADNYRKITITPIIGKIIEKELAKNIQEQVCQEPLQYGFTRGVSSSSCALLITEAIAEAEDRGSPLYIVYLDAKKAFDLVDHQIMLNAMSREGLNSHTWSLLSELYSRVESCVKLDGNLSRTIIERQGVRQGAVTSTEAFKGKSNDLLRRIRNHPDAFKIGCTSVGGPTTADDTALLSNSVLGIQSLLHLAQEDANRGRYLFSTSKSRMMTIFPEDRILKSPPVYLNGAPIETSDSEKHLGIARNISTTSQETVNQRISQSRRTMYSLAGAGLYGTNGLPPEVMRSMLRIYTIPVLLYGLESLSLSEKNYSDMEKFHLNQLRRIQSLPCSTAKPAVYLLIGMLPVKAEIHRKILTLFMSLLLRTGSTENDIIRRQLVMKDLQSHSWTTQVRVLLHKYSLPDAFTLLLKPVEITAWKRHLRKTITNYWLRHLREEASTMSSLTFLNLQACNLDHIHQVWRKCSSERRTQQATIHASLLVQRYPLSGLSCAGVRTRDCCPLCAGGPETTAHFLVSCRALEKTRHPHMQKINSYLQLSRQPPPDRETEVAQLILDHSRLDLPPDTAEKISEEARVLCFRLHVARTKIMAL